MNTSGEMKYSLRNSHSLSLDNYHMDIPETLNVKDRQVLCNRGVTFAGFTPDTSKVLIQETHHRRNLHQEMINLNPKIFVRYDHLYPFYWMYFYCINIGKILKIQSFCWITS